MILYILRHGIAVDVGEKGVRQDADRMLSDDGRRKTLAAVKGLNVIGCKPKRIVSSPLIRAVETAEIAARGLAPKLKVETNDLLSPDAKMRDLVEWLATQDAKPTMVVGHMPDLATLASVMLSGGKSIQILLKKTSACCISFPGQMLAGSGGLEWLIQPKILRLLAEND